MDKKEWGKKEPSDEIEGFTIIGYDRQGKPFYRADYRRGSDI